MAAVEGGGKSSQAGHVSASGGLSQGPLNPPVEPGLPVVGRNYRWNHVPPYLVC